MRGTVRERLYARLTPCANLACDCDGCLLWAGSGNGRGYGLIWVGDRMRRVHRVAWELDYGPIPDGLTVDHVRARGCRHRHCANVAHLEPVTMRENLMRGNTPAAINATKKRCHRDHPFDDDNTYRDRRGWRRCRTCRHLRERVAVTS